MIASRRFESLEAQGVHEADMLLAELDVYEMFARTYCKGRRRKIALCDSLQVRPVSCDVIFLVTDVGGLTSLQACCDNS